MHGHWLLRRLTPSWRLHEHTQIPREYVYRENETMTYKALSSNVEFCCSACRIRCQGRCSALVLARRGRLRPLFFSSPSLSPSSSSLSPAVITTPFLPPAFSPHYTNSQARSLDVIEVRRITPAPRASSVIPESRHKRIISFIHWEESCAFRGRSRTCDHSLSSDRVYRADALAGRSGYLAFHPVACLV